MLMTDRATYVTYLETQLERVTSALLATQNHNNGQTAAEIQLKGIAEQLGSLEEKVASPDPDLHIDCSQLPQTGA